jgi:hypothetical protein
MSGVLDTLQTKLQNLASNETSPDALRIIEVLGKELDTLRAELLYERLDTPEPLPSTEMTAFKAAAYKKLKDDRAADMVMLYNRGFFEDKQPATRLCLAQVFVTIAKEQNVAVPPLWQNLLDSRGHL